MMSSSKSIAAASSIPLSSIMISHAFLRICRIGKGTILALAPTWRRSTKTLMRIARPSLPAAWVAAVVP